MLAVSEGAGLLFAAAAGLLAAAEPAASGERDIARVGNCSGDWRNHGKFTPALIHTGLRLVNSHRLEIKG